MPSANCDVIGMSLVKAPSDNINTTSSNLIPDNQHSNCPTLRDALQVYLDQKDKGRPNTFRITAERSCKYVFGLSGNKLLSS